MRLILVSLLSLVVFASCATPSNSVGQQAYQRAYAKAISSGQSKTTAIRKATVASTKATTKHVARSGNYSGGGGAGRSNFDPKYSVSRAPANATHWLNHKTLKRHNRGCRYYGKTEKGRASGPNEGIACGVCGG